MKNHVMSSTSTQSQLYTVTLIKYCLSTFMFNFGYFVRHLPHFSLSESHSGNHMSVAEKTDT